MSEKGIFGDNSSSQTKILSQKSGFLLNRNLIHFLSQFFLFLFLALIPSFISLIFYWRNKVEYENVWSDSFLIWVYALSFSLFFVFLLFETKKFIGKRKAILDFDFRDLIISRSFKKSLTDYKNPLFLQNISSKNGRQKDLGTWRVAGNIKYSRAEDLRIIKSSVRRVVEKYIAFLYLEVDAFENLHSVYFVTFVDQEGRPVRVIFPNPSFFISIVGLVKNYWQNRIPEATHLHSTLTGNTVCQSLFEVHPEGALKEVRDELPLILKSQSDKKLEQRNYFQIKGIKIDDRNVLATSVNFGGKNYCLLSVNLLENYIQNFFNKLNQFPKLP